MKYRIQAAKSVKDELAEIWLAATDKNAVTLASAQLDKDLSRTPLLMGESRTSSVHRIHVFNRLAIEFEVIEDDKKVIYLHYTYLRS